MRRRVGLFAASVLMAAASGLACQARPLPDDLFAEAEALRPKYTTEASQQAIVKYSEAVKAWENKGQRHQAANAAQRLGATYEQLGLLQESLAAYQAALKLARESSDLTLESEILSDVGIAGSLVANREDRFDEARRHCEAALELARQSRGQRGIGKALTCLGEVSYYRKQPEQALEHYRRGAEVWDLLHDRRGQAQTLLAQGTVYSDLRDFDEAQRHYDRARPLWTALGDTRAQAIAMVADARLHVRRGAYQEALNEFERALALLEPMGDAVWQASSLTGIARVYLDMGEWRSAVDYWERALQLFERAGLHSISVDVLGSLGETYLASGDDAKALNRFERAFALADEQGIQLWKAKALRFLGVVYLFRRQADVAQQYFERSLEQQRSVGDPRLEARTRANLGEIYDLIGDAGVAVKHFETALALSRGGADRVTEASAFFGLARSSRRTNALDVSRGYIESALKLVESLRTEVESRDLRTSYFASVHQYHQFYMDVLMRLHSVRPAAGLAGTAFEASERARARSLLDSLTGAAVDLRTGANAALLAREQELKIAFDDWSRRQRQLTGAGSNEAHAKALADEYRGLELRYNQIHSEIRSKSPRYAALVRPQPLTLKEVQQEVLDSNTLLLEYALGEERSYLWAVSRAGYASHELPSRAEIESAAQRVYDRLTARLTATGTQRDRRRHLQQADDEYWKEAQRLSVMLLGPVANKMPGKRILIVADGALQYLPFAALPVPGREDGRLPLVLEHEIVSLPSASVLAAVRRETRDRKPVVGAVAVLADPVFETDDPRLHARAGATKGIARAGLVRDGTMNIPRLAATRQEAAAIVAAAPPGSAFEALDFDASRATAIGPELAKYQILHFATHGIVNDDQPGLGGIVLSMFDRQGQPQDGFLRLHDIYNLNLPAELVVLSACNTALGKSVKGEGLVGIVRGFMYAGAKRVVASHWKVDDEATAELMGRFYVEMFKNNRTPAAALREAQLAIRQHERWQSPFYWAAFVLQGEWN